MDDAASKPESTFRTVALFFRTSVREILLLMAFVGFAFTALRYASETMWSIVSWLALFGIMLLGVLVVAARGRWKAFAAGAAVCAGLYAFVVLFIGDWRDEATQLKGFLPTSKASMTLYLTINDTYWIDANTGERLADDDPRVVSWNTGGGGIFGPSKLNLQWREELDRFLFFPIAHAIWGMIFAYFGGRLGYFLAKRREEDLRSAVLG